MSVYDNELEANRVVIENLLNEIRRLVEMSYLKLSDGRFIKVNKEDYIVIERSEVEAALQERKNKVTELSGILTDAPAEQSSEPEVQAPPAPTPEQQPAPQPQTISVATPQPTETVAAQPEQPAPQSVVPVIA